MKKYAYLILFLSLILVGCQQKTQDGIDENASTKDRVYSGSLDGNPVIVEQRNNKGDLEKINEITNNGEIETLIESLKNADWKENVKVDIRPSDYSFIWNSYKHGVWINKDYERLELEIYGQSNFGTLSSHSSEVVYQILTGKSFNDELNGHD